MVHIVEVFFLVLIPITWQRLSTNERSWRLTAALQAAPVIVQLKKSCVPIFCNALHNYTLDTTKIYIHSQIHIMYRGWS